MDSIGDELRALDETNYSSTKDMLQDADLAAVTGGAVAKESLLISAALSVLAYVLPHG